MSRRGIDISMFDVLLCMTIMGLFAAIAAHLGGALLALGWVMGLGIE